MACKRAGTQLLKVFQQAAESSSVEFRSVLDSRLPALVIPRSSTLLQPKVGAISSHVEWNQYAGRSFSSRTLYSEAQATRDNEDTNEYEHSKMSAEGGGSDSKFNEKVKEIKESMDSEQLSDMADKLGDVKQTAYSAAENITDRAKEVSTPKDGSTSSIQNVSETATELKEVAVEAAKAVGRDVGKLADKVGLNEQNISDLKEVAVEARKAAGRDLGKVAGKLGVDTENAAETTKDLKEVGIETGKAVKQDAEKGAVKVGLKSDKN